MRPRKRQSGVALITALLVVSIATVASIEMISRQSLDIRRTANLIEGDQAWLYVDAAETWAKAILARDLSENKTDSLGDTWAFDLPPIELPGGYLVGNLEDLEGRFNLNNLVEKGVINAASVRQFERLLAVLGLEPSLAQAVVDWIDTDIEALAPNGAEDDYYAGLENPYRTPNRIMGDVSELRLIKGFDKKTADKLLPYVTALPTRTTINVNTASPEVLASLADRVNAGRVAKDISGRKEKPFTRPEDVIKLSAFKDANIDKDGRSSLGVTSKHFFARIETRIGRGRASVGSVIFRGGPNDIQVLYRTQGQLPRPVAGPEADTGEGQAGDAG
ncbi:MAG: type II secretion system minor pseudopilin GspK [Gammaproteobacteria bacterium]|jgi:general secretion pathway protein K|nr:type II secretion system minor pseudopilin GspK [Gammaproteobacteria bacterium]